MDFVSINKRTYALGLWWNVTKTHSRAKLLEEAKEFNKKHPVKHNYVTALKKQYGLAQDTDNDLPEYYSLAASIVNQIPNESGNLFLFCLAGNKEEGLWWVFACENKMILAEGDQVFTTYIEALKEINSMKSFFVDSKVTEFTSPEASAKYLKDKINNTGKIFNISKNSQNKQIIIAILAFLVVLGIGLNKVYTYYENKKIQELIEEEASKKLSTEAHIAKIQSEAAKYFTNEFENMYSNPELFSLCQQNMFTLPVIDKGWDMVSMSCNGANIIVNWTNTSNAANYLVLPEKSKLSGNRAAQSNIPLQVQNIPKLAVNLTDLKSMDLASRHFYQKTQDFGLLLSLTWKEPEKQLVDKAEIVAPWRVGNIVIDSIPSSLLHTEFIKKINYPGFIIKKVVRTNNTWKIEGVIYAN